MDREWEVILKSECCPYCDKHPSGDTCNYYVLNPDEYVGRDTTRRWIICNYSNCPLVYEEGVEN